MTYYSSSYYRDYEWTAFREEDLLQPGDSNLNCGDKFYMPASATVCLSTVDNDRTMSGDGCRDDQASDRSGQKAYVDGERVGGQFYAESYHVLKGTDGNTYYLIEIEIEGSSQDYFSFYGDVPPAGVCLTVVNTCNVRGDWVDYKCLDAGPKEPPVEYGSVEGTVWCDADCDGIQDMEITYEKGENIWKDSVTFESVTCTTYNVCDYGSWKSTGSRVIDLVVGNDQGHNGNPHDNTLVELDKGGVWTRNFTVDEAGTYCLTFDTFKNFCVDDGGNTFKVKVNGVVVDVVVVSADGEVELSIDLPAGANSISFISESDVAGYGAGIDNIELLPLVEVSTATEMGKAGVVVKLVDLDGNVVAETTTDADGNYRFDNVPVGEYKVMGVAPDGTNFTIQDAGSDDSVDSDVDGSGTSGTISVTKDQTTDVDLGLCDKPEPGSLSGRYFCDTNDNAQDDGNGGEPPVAGVRVILLDAAGDPAVDMDGNPVAAVYTDANGEYSFGNLAAGSYTVVFDDVDGVTAGKQLVDPNVGDDASDSDAIGTAALSQITGIVVVAGEDTPDNDAGIFEPNTDPDAVDDMGKGCADEFIYIDLLANDSDADGDTVSVASISDADETVGVGGTLTLDGGATVTLNADGTVTVDGATAYASLGLGDTASDSFSYTLTDDQGGTAMANVDVTFCGYASLETVAGLVEGSVVTYTVDQPATAAEFIEGYSLSITGSTSADIPLGTYELAYCIDFVQDITPGVVSTGNILVATEANAASVGMINADNIDAVNWLLNNDQTLVDNGDGTGDTYTDLEIQEAIWVLMNGDNFIVNKFAVPEYTDDENGIRDGVEVATLENINEIVQIAQLNGDGFVPEDGDVFGLIIDPTSPDSQHQPFIIGVEYECVC